MTDLIKGTILLLTRLDELKGADRRVILKTLDESFPEVMSSLSELVIGSIDVDFERTGLLDEVLSEDGSILVKEAIDLCYKETSGTHQRGGVSLAATNIEHYCDENSLCNACFGELHKEDIHTCVDIEEYHGARVSRMTNTGYTCPHCGFEEVW